MPNQTPGPWKSARVFGNNAPDTFKVFTKPFGGVCVADCGDNEENAKLCAAGPEMLEALKYAAEIIKTARQYFPKSVSNTDRYRLESTCAAIGSAIHKAEGKD